MPEADTIHRFGAHLDAELSAMLATTEVTLDHIRQAVRDGATTLAVDLTAVLVTKVQRLAALFPEEA